ncbi:MAG: AI-2E family transporter [Actinomycetota bacterium]|nr:AI-2E family transporter [Actinomycetota bacterium]
MGEESGHTRDSELAERLERAARRAEDAADSAVVAEHDAESAARDAGSQADRADSATHAAEEAQALAEAVIANLDPADPLLDTHVRSIVAQVSEQHPLGRRGKPMSARSPFRLAFSAALGVLAAVALARAVMVVEQVLVLIVTAAFLAMGLDPAVAWLCRFMRRALAVTIVALAAVLFVGGFVAAAAPPVATQATHLIEAAPGYAQRLQDNNSQLAKLNKRFHVVDRLRERANGGLNINALGGVLGLGKAILTGVLSTVTVLILTLYLLANFPDIKRGAYRLVPRSRRARFGLLTDEVLARVGGYVLGNLATSVVATVAAALYLFIVGVPSPIALGLFVGITDLIPLVGASLGAVVVTVVALFVSVPVGLSTIGYFFVYQQIENYWLVPKVMKRTVDVSPLVTIIAALLGAALFGILGALLAIPVAAAIQLVMVEVLYPRQDEA